MRAFASSSFVAILDSSLYSSPMTKSAAQTSPHTNTFISSKADILLAATLPGCQPKKLQQREGERSV